MKPTSLLLPHDYHRQTASGVIEQVRRSAIIASVYPRSTEAEAVTIGNLGIGEVALLGLLSVQSQY